MAEIAHPIEGCEEPRAKKRSDPHIEGTHRHSAEVEGV